jgi:nicotinate-nucleotide adenylyltransferase
MHIALFGGSFDPPHKGHLLVAKTLIDRKLVDEVWFVPCAVHPFNKTLTSSVTRLKMLESVPNLKISTYELDNPGPNYSIDTIEHFAKQYPEHTFSWVMGADQIQHFTKWHRYQDILNTFHIFVYPRATYDTTHLLPGMTLLSDVELSDVSSTHIRKSVHENKDISQLTNQPVADVINTSHLYKE